MFLDEVACVRGAAAALGWDGAAFPVRIAGEDAWAIASVETLPVLTSTCGRVVRRTDGQGTSTVVVSGVLVTGPATSKTTDRASVYAGYCPRAVLVPDGPGVVPVMMAAAVLGQGVVVAGDSGLIKLSDAGPAIGREWGEDVALEDGEAAHVTAGQAASARRVLVEQVERVLSR